ncbi:MAG: DNA-binding protein [bacterium]|nr:MAG: DNA-binding protein [bacterium]
MNFSSTIAKGAIKGLLSAAWFLIPAVIIIIILKSSWFKGIIGEFIVNVLAKMMLNKKEYCLIKNVTLLTEDGTTQIDHIIVSKYGVFVVETKNLKGWIFGDPDQKTWTQKIYKYSNKFQNPLRQNYKHIKTLESLLGLKDDQVHSLVVFVGDSIFKTKMPANVTYGLGYIRYIKSKKDIVLSDDQVEKIVKEIESGRLTRSFKTHRDHINYVKDIVSQKQNSRVCPKCGSPMVLRIARKGNNTGKKFWACSAYPKCRYIKDCTSSNKSAVNTGIMRPLHNKQIHSFL